MARRITSVAVAAMALLAVTPDASGLVNPSLQPLHLFERCDSVLCMKIVSVDAKAHRAVMEVTEVCKGKFAAKKVTLTADDEGVEDAFEVLARKGTTVVAFAGQTHRRRANDVLFYPGGEGRWQRAQMNDSHPSRWQWTEDIDPFEDERMLGTFNGASERLADMMVDKKHGRYFFPPVPFMRFGQELVIARFEKRIRGVALYDLNGDGRLDVYACSDGGDRAFLQTADLKFTDSTKALGLGGLRSPSVSMADVNADGLPDILAGALIRLAVEADGKRRFRASDLLPARAAADLKSASFAEINGDGYPDVVVSRAAGGLHLYLNGGAKGGRFADATAAAGLDKKACGAGLTGFFTVGDANGDGRTDLFYSAGKGLLLVQDAKGRFHPFEHHLEFDFTTGGQAEGLTGAGCVAPLWRPHSADIVFPNENNVCWAGLMGGKLTDLTPYGNEIWEGANGLIATIAEDLNADGRVDIYSVNRQVFRNKIHTNRGYGSFMTPLNYSKGIFQGQAHFRGGWGAAAGDANGDGANDLLLGGADGALVLIVNDCLAARKPKKHPTSQERVLQRTRLLTVRVRGKVGVLGATVSLADASGRVVARRVLGANVATGCRGPDAVNFAVREPGALVLTVRFSDGCERTWTIDSLKEMHSAIRAQREEQNEHQGD
jgi:hypothetical protein